MGDFLQVMGWLFFILACLIALLYLLKRFAPKAALAVDGKLTILGQVGLGPKKSLVVVRFLNKMLVLGVTDTQINLITEMTTDESTSFEDVLGKTSSANSDSGSD